MRLFARRTDRFYLLDVVITAAARCLAFDSGIDNLVVVPTEAQLVVPQGKNDKITQPQLILAQRIAPFLNPLDKHWDSAETSQNGPLARLDPFSEGDLLFAG